MKPKIPVDKNISKKLLCVYSPISKVSPRRCAKISCQGGNK